MFAIRLLPIAIGSVLLTCAADMLHVYKVAKLVAIYIFENMGRSLCLPSHSCSYFLSILWLTDSVANHSRDVNASRARRVSISSTEDNIDLEASLPPLRVPPAHSYPAPVPESEEPGPESIVSQSGTGNGGSLGRSRSPTVGVLGIANKLRSSIASLGSPHGPVPGGSETIWTSKKNFATDTQLLFKRRITNLYVQVSALRSYVELNYSGFRKVLKK
jgi:phosphate transporter